MPRKLSNWLNEYLNFVSDTEPPLCYHQWCALGIVGQSVKRNVYMQRDFRFYPNQYIILVGPPGVGKGNAIKPATSLAKSAGTVNYLSDRITAERIIEKLAIGFSRPSVSPTGTGILIQDSSATILSTELPVFLGSSDWMLPYLCEMWDKNEFDYDTKTKGTKNIKDLCVSLIGGCVPDFIRKLNKDATSAITGGFTSRCIFVYSSSKGKSIPWPQTKAGSQLETDLIEDLRFISGLQGEMKFSPRGFQKYIAYHNTCEQNGKFDQQVIIHFKSRAPTHMLKTAMSLSLAETDSLILEEHHIDMAISLTNEVQNNLEKTFRFVGENNELVACQNIMDFLEFKGSASFNEILASNYRYAPEDAIERILNTMVRMGFCEFKNGQYICLNKKKKP